MTWAGMGHRRDWTDAHTVSASTLGRARNQHTLMSVRVLLLTPFYVCSACLFEVRSLSSHGCDFAFHVKSRH